MNKNKFLNSKELEHLEQLLWKSMKDDTRNCLLLLLAMKTGARAQEMLNLTKEDINYQEKSLYIKTLKNGQDRELPVHPKIFSELLRYLKTVQGDLLFPISYRRFVQIWEMYRPVKKCLHSLRHSRAISVYKKSRSIHLVKTMLGHKSAITSNCYLEFVESTEQLRKAML